MVCRLTFTVDARRMAERPRFRRSFPRLVSISGIFYVVILNQATGRAMIYVLSFLRYIDILTRHEPATSNRPFRRSADLCSNGFRTGWKSGIVRRDSGSAGSRGGASESDRPGGGR